MEVIMKCVSKHKKERRYKKTGDIRTLQGGGMYLFIYGKGSNRTSETKHLTEAQANSYKKELEKL